MPYLNKKNVVKIFRGNIERPLYISSVGYDLSLSAEFIKKMHGNYRFPTLLRILDQETRDIKESQL